MKKKPTQGGARPGAGAKLKYGEPTTRLYFSVPVSKKDEIKMKVDLILKEYEKASKGN